jgi:hypothetical protein
MSNDPLFTPEMQRALEADGEKLRQVTGDEHGPVFLTDLIDGYPTRETYLPLLHEGDPVTRYVGEPVPSLNLYEGWYFYDETFANAHGPYKSEAKAREMLQHYIHTQLEGEGC